MARPNCLLCTAKHLSQALINYTESKLGYPSYWILVIGQMAEAESESHIDWPDLANAIRQERTNYMENRNYVPKIMDLINWIDALIDEPKKKRRKT